MSGAFTTSTKLESKDTHGKTLLVSGASGACGSYAGQIGKVLGYKRVVGITSSMSKAEWLLEIGFDHVAIMPRGSNDFGACTAEVARACPDGVDSYFDNVGGYCSAAVAPHMNEGSRVAICGVMTQMGKDVADQSWMEVAEMRGAAINFVRYAELLEDTATLLQLRGGLRDMVASSQLRTEYTVYDGLEDAPDWFTDFFTSSKGLGKKVLRAAA